MEVRRKEYPDGRKVLLCNGNNNTCEKEVRTNGKCKSCNNGTASKNMGIGLEDGTIFTNNGIRYKRANGQSRKLCTGKNNTCETVIMLNGLCSACTPKQPKEKKEKPEQKKGDITVSNGIRYMYNGHQKCKLCNGDNDTCMKYALAKSLTCAIHTQK